MVAPAVASAAVATGSSAAVTVVLTIASLIVALLLVVAIVWSFTTCARSTNNRKSGIALAIALIGWLLAGAELPLLLWSRDLSAVTKPLAICAALAAGMAMLGAIIASVWLAIAGLAEIVRNPTRYRHGLMQSSFAIVLGVALTNVFVVIVMMRPPDAATQATLAQSSLAQESLAQPPSQPFIPRQTEPRQPPSTRPVGDVSALTTSAPPAAVAAPATPVSNNRDTFEEFNFTFEKPAPPWAPWNVKLNTETPTVCQYLRIWPSVFFLIIPEKIGVERTISEEDFIATSMAFMKSATTDATLVEQRVYTMNGITGRRLLVHATAEGRAVSYVRWLILTNGYAYQLTVFGERANERTVQSEADKMFARFRLIDSTRLAHSQGGGRAAPMASAQHPGAAVGTFHSKDYGYSAAPGAGWGGWPHYEATFPSAEFASLLGDSSAMIVIPMVLQGVDADTETLAAALCMRLGMPFDRTTDHRPTESGLVQSYTGSFQREADGQRWDYRFKVLRRGSVALLMAGWTNAPARLADVEGALAGVKFDERPVWPTLSSMRGHDRSKHALLYNEVGLQLITSRNAARSVPWFEQAVELAPEDQTIFDNLITAYVDSDQVRVARLRLNRAMQRQPDNAKLRALAGFIESQMGDVDLAIQLYGDAFAKGYRDETSFLYYARLLARQQRWDDLLTAAERFGKNFESIEVGLLHAMAMGHKDQRQRAIELLQSLRRRDPNHTDVAAELGAQYVELEKFDEALAIADELIRAGRGEPDIYLLQAQAEAGRKQFRNAKTALEAALAKDPNHKPARDFLGYVSAMLGEGENSSIQQSIDPVPLPPTLASMPAAPADFGKDQGACFLLNLAAISFLPGKEQRQTDYRTLRILDTRGADLFGTLHFDFDPLLESIYVNKVEVTDAQGKVLSTVKPSDCWVTDAMGDSGISQDKTLNVPVSGLAAGTTIQAIVTRKEKHDPTAMRFVRRMLCSTVPIARSAIYLKGDLKNVRHKALNAPPPQPVDGEPQALCWMIESPPVFHYEAQQAEICEFVPIVLLGDASSDWPGAAKEYLAQLAPMLAPDPDTTALARRLTSGLTDERSKVAALLRHVQEDYTYKAIEFGRRARIPQKPADIIRNRYGDCKDHALLLRQLLEAAGIRAHLALARAYDGIEPQLPTLDQFDHMVVYAPSVNLGGTGSGVAIFDCTDKDSDPRVGLPIHLAGKQLLVLDPANVRLETVPGAAADSSVVVCARKLAISDGGDLTVHETATFRGAPGAFLRQMLRNVEPAKRSRALQQALASMGVDANVGDVRVEHLTDATEALVLETDYRFRNRFNKAGTMWVGRLPASWERYWLLPDRLAERHSPVHVRYPLKVETRATLLPPPGTALREPPANASAPATPFGSWQIAAHRAPDGGLALESLVRTPELRLPASSYSDYYQQRESLIGQLEPTIVLEPAKK
jgi:tetratricopeptide (TPR) repeat protein